MGTRPNAQPQPRRFQHLPTSIVRTVIRMELVTEDGVVVPPEEPLTIQTRLVDSKGREVTLRLEMEDVEE